MNIDPHYRKLENMYLSAPTNDYYQPQISISKGKAEITIDVQKKMFHAAGALHGSVYFKALDDSAFFAANSLHRESYVLTANFTIYLTRPVSTGKIKATGKVLNSTRTQFIAESILTNADGKEIARGIGSFAKSKVPLTADIGYKL